ncbi:MAG: hypothetical protein QY321_03940 [Patescibacteria group bacterium]|nr:MAG: hypothetical protein QY321_03940 [Patescibacteria group bacterium]
MLKRFKDFFDCLATKEEKIGEVIEFKREDIFFVFNELPNDFQNQYVLASPGFILVRYFSLTIKVGDEIFHKRIDLDHIKSIKIFYPCINLNNHVHNILNARKKLCKVRIRRFFFLKFVSLL